MHALSIQRLLYVPYAHLFLWFWCLSVVRWKHANFFFFPNHFRCISPVDLDDANKLRKERPPLPRVSSAIRKSTNGLNTSGTATPVTQPATPKDTPKRAPATERRLTSARKVSQPMSWLSITVKQISLNLPLICPLLHAGVPNFEFSELIK